MFTYELNTKAGKTFATGTLNEKHFASGNDGYFGNDKTALPKVAHLSGDPIEIVLRENGKSIAVFFAVPRTFSTGSYGYWAGGKVFTSSGETQAQVQLVLVGSKGVAGDGLKALNNKYQLQAQAVLLHGVKLADENPVHADVEAAIAAIAAAA